MVPLREQSQQPPHDVSLLRPQRQAPQQLQTLQHPQVQQQQHQRQQRPPAWGRSDSGADAELVAISSSPSDNFDFEDVLLAAELSTPSLSPPGPQSAAGRLELSPDLLAALEALAAAEASSEEDADAQGAGGGFGGGSAAAGGALVASSDAPPHLGQQLRRQRDVGATNSMDRMLHSMGMLSTPPRASSRISSQTAAASAASMYGRHGGSSSLWEIHTGDSPVPVRGMEVLWPSDNTQQ